MIPSWTAQKNDCKNNTKSINRLGSKSRLRSRLIKPTNQLNQQLTNQLNHWPIESMTDQEYLFDKAKNNWTTKTKNKWTTKTYNLVRPNAIKRFTKQSIKQIIKNDCLAKPKTINQTNTKTIIITANVGWSLEPVWILDQGLKVWNWPRAWSQLQSLIFKRLI